MSLPTTDWFEKWNLYAPQRIAVRFADTQQSMTYGELHHGGQNLALWLKNNYGLQSGDRVAVLSEFNVAWLYLFAAAFKSGIVLVPLNYRLSGPELEYQLQHSGSSLCVVQEQYESLIASASIKTIATSNIEQQALLHQKGVWNFPIPEEQDPVFILYTSGTTGLPKGALYTRKMLFWNSINTAMSLIVNTESRTLNVMPPFHTGGWNVLLTPFLHHGAYTVLLNKFEPGTVLRLMQEEKVTLFMAVPTMLQMLVKHPDFERASFPNLHYLIVGGEPMPIPLIETWNNKGVPVRQGYGMTEVGPNLTSLHQDDAIRKKGSIGFPNFYVSAKIVNEQGKELPAGQAGELWIKGPMVTPGYWNQPDAAKVAFSEDGEWFKTGDMVVRDNEQYLYVVDRIKNMYISGGENVYPAEIERVLIQSPAIAEVAVVGMPDDKWGESGCAFLVAKAGMEPPSLEALQELCKMQLAKFKVPKKAIWLEALPKTDSGKINRQRLKLLAKEVQNKT